MKGYEHFEQNTKYAELALKSIAKPIRDGDRVFSKVFGTGTFISKAGKPCMVVFDKQNHMLHDCNGACNELRGWFFSGDSGMYSELVRADDAS